MTQARLQRIAAALLIFLGAGHLCLLLALDGIRMAHWFTEGLWAAVPLRSGPRPTVEGLQNAAVFWAGIGGLAVPTILLGCALWQAGPQGWRPPAPFGWAVVAWFAVFSVILVPSPAFLGVISGGLMIVATHAKRPDVF